MDTPGPRVPWHRLALKAFVQSDGLRFASVLPFSVTGQATALSSSFSASDALSLSPGCAACSPPPLPCVLAPPAATDPGAASTGQPQLQPHVTSSLHAPGGERGGENSEGEDGRWAGPASSLVAGAFAAQQQQLFSQQPLQLQQQGKDSVAAAVAAAASEVCAFHEPQSLTLELFVDLHVTSDAARSPSIHCRPTTSSSRSGVPRTCSSTRRAAPTTHIVSLALDRPCTTRRAACRECEHEY